jgi:hypothetical protein
VPARRSLRLPAREDLVARCLATDSLLR